MNKIIQHDLDRPSKRLCKKLVEKFSWSILVLMTSLRTLGAVKADTFVHVMLLVDWGTHTVDGYSTLHHCWELLFQFTETKYDFTTGWS